MDDEIEVIDSPTDTDDTETEGTVEAEPAVDVAKLQDTNKKLFERAKKAETDLKALRDANKPAPKAQAQQTPSTPNADVEEVVLKAQGMDPELLKQLKDVSQFKGISLLDAQKDELFIAVKDKFDAAQKSKAAAVGVSRGSGSPAVKATLATPQLSVADHKALFKERLGR